jgi:hypothetical protein
LHRAPVRPDADSDPLMRAFLREVRRENSVYGHTGLVCSNFDWSPWLQLGFNGQAQYEKCSRKHVVTYSGTYRIQGRGVILHYNSGKIAPGWGLPPTELLPAMNQVWYVSPASRTEEVPTGDPAKFKLSTPGEAPVFGPLSD